MVAAGDSNQQARLTSSGAAASRPYGGSRSCRRSRWRTGGGGARDALLDDDAFFAPFVAYFDPVMGRPLIPIETYDSGRAEKRCTSPISATKIAAYVGPTPGSAWMAW